VQGAWGRVAETGQDRRLAATDRLARAENGATQAASRADDEKG